METALHVVFARIEAGRLWRAYLAGAEHCGGVGTTPQEALGWLVFHHPERFGVGAFAWLSRPPKLPGHPAEAYPAGPIGLGQG